MLFVNQYVEIEDREGNLLVAQIHDIGLETFQIGSIIGEPHVSVPGLVAQEVFVYFLRGSGEKFQFKTKVVTQIEREPVKLQLAIPEDSSILKVQKREFFRVPTEVIFELEMTKNGHRSIQFQTKDLSGGGLSFVTEDPPLEVIDSGIKGFLFIEVGETSHKLPFEARVVNQKQIKHKIQMSLEFTLIRESHRNIILKFCMKEQLKRRK